MRLRRLVPLLVVLASSPGCHRLTRYHGISGTIRHGAGLNIAGSLTLALCALAGLGGAFLLADGIVQPERYDRWQALWGAFLLILAALVALGVRSEFRYLRSCC